MTPSLWRDQMHYTYFSTMIPSAIITWPFFYPFFGPLSYSFQSAHALAQALPRLLGGDSCAWYGSTLIIPGPTEASLLFCF